MWFSNLYVLEHSYMHSQREMPWDGGRLNSMDEYIRVLLDSWWQFALLIGIWIWVCCFMSWVLGSSAIEWPRKAEGPLHLGVLGSVLMNRSIQYSIGGHVLKPYCHTQCWNGVDSEDDHDDDDDDRMVRSRRTTNGNYNADCDDHGYDDHDNDDGDDGSWGKLKSQTEMEMTAVCISCWWFMLFELEQVNTLL